MNYYNLKIPHFIKDRIHEMRTPKRVKTGTRIIIKERIVLQ